MPEVHTRYTLGSRSTKRLTLSSFKGVDLTSGPANVDPCRSPDAPNMLPDASGSPVKRPGYERVYSLGGAVHGVYELCTPTLTARFIHAGTGLYRDGVFIAGGMNDAASMAVQLDGTLWITDGKTFRYLREGENGSLETGPVSEIAAVPVISLSKGPQQDSAATSYQPLNLLTGRRTESFLGTEDAADYYLSFEGLSDAPVTAEVRDTEGSWNTLSEGSGFSVDRTLGLVRFLKAPGAPVPTGEDNVRITYTVEDPDALAEINRCRFGILYGVNGALDRVFLSGNPDEPNTDRWSEYRDPTFFGDTNYGLLGSEAAPIVGYSVLNDRLVAHKRGEENDRNAFVRTGTLDEDGDALFTITGVIQGRGAASGRCCAALGSEPVFLAPDGVYALTASDITGERYNQKRSFYIDGQLQSLDLQDACACLWGRFYVLAAGGSLYLLDTDQKSYESRAAASSFQYECYVWPDIPAALVWAWDGRLWFGDSAGNVFAFYEADGTPGHYRDWDGTAEGAPISAWWATPLLPLGDLGRQKTVPDTWVSIQPYTRSGGTIYTCGSQTEEAEAARWSETLFSWADLDFDAFSFRSSDTPCPIRCGRPLYGVQLYRVRAAGTEEDEPFGLYGIEIEYKTGLKCPV